MSDERSQPLPAGRAEKTWLAPIAIIGGAAAVTLIQVKVTGASGELPTVSYQSAKPPSLSFPSLLNENNWRQKERRESMFSLGGKTGLVVGVANARSIAWGCATTFKALGAELAVTYVSERTRAYVEPIASVLGVEC